MACARGGMTSALIPSNSVNRSAPAFHSSYAQCGSSMLEFSSTDFGYELSVNYARPGNLVACYPEGNENSFSLAWEPQPMYPYQPQALNCEFGGLFGASGAAGAAARQNHLMHQRFGHHGKAGPTPGPGGLHHPHPTSNKSKTRRRVATVAQRGAANIRERRRMFGLNEAFDILRRKVPTFAYEKRLSRIETLRLAITYIAFMTEVLQGKYPRDDALFTDNERPDAPWIPQQSLSNPLSAGLPPGQCRGHGSP